MAYTVFCMKHFLQKHLAFPVGQPTKEWEKLINNLTFLDLLYKPMRAPPS